MTREEFCNRYGLTDRQFDGGDEFGGSLYLSSLTSIPEGFNPTVGGYLYLRSGSKYIGANVENLSWQNGKFMLVDGVLTEVKKRRGSAFNVRIVGKRKDSYLVTDGNGAWAHGDTIKEAKEDLLFKLSERSAEEYKALRLSDKLSFGDAVAFYRSITGACSAGCRHFCEQHGLSTSKKYSVQEIVTLTNGAYGSEALARFSSQLPK